MIILGVFNPSHIYLKDQKRKKKKNPPSLISFSDNPSLPLLVNQPYVTIFRTTWGNNRHKVK